MRNFLNNLVALALPSAFLYYFFIIPLRKVLRARNWLETPCVILSSAVEEDATDSGLYRYLVTYEYEIAGRSYESRRYSFSIAGQGYRPNRFGFSTGATSGYRGKKAVVDRLPPGKETVC